MMPSWLADAWKEYLGPSLAWVWTLPIWQPLVLVLLTTAWLAYKWRDTLARRVLGEDDRSHDVAVFQKLNAVADEEFVGDVINRHLFTLSAPTDDLYKLWEFVTALERIENRYLSPDVRRQAENLVCHLMVLRATVGRTFFRTERGWVKFYPDDIDSGVWDREHEELNAHIEAAWIAYKAYRQVVKERLRV